MSVTTIQKLWLGQRVEDGPELRNAWGSAPVVWDFLWKTYIDSKPENSYYLSNPDRLWPLWKDARVPECLRAMHFLTFDRAYVKRCEFQRMANDIDAGIKMIGPSGGTNHWPTIAEYLRCAPDCEAVGLYCTSVSQNPFRGEWNEEAEDYDPFDWSQAHDIYAELDQLTTPPGGPHDPH